jgi:hypothetical protein
LSLTAGGTKTKLTFSLKKGKATPANCGEEDIMSEPDETPSVVKTTTYDGWTIVVYNSAEYQPRTSSSSAKRMRMLTFPRSRT